MWLSTLWTGSPAEMPGFFIISLIKESDLIFWGCPMQRSDMRASYRKNMTFFLLNIIFYSQLVEC